MDSDEPPVVRQEPSVGCWCVMQILWPAFLLATVAAGLIFSLVHPEDISVVQEYLHGEPMAAYTLAFLALWLLFAASSALTLFLAQQRMRSLGEQGAAT